MLSLCLSLLLFFVCLPLPLSLFPSIVSLSLPPSSSCAVRLQLHAQGYRDMTKRGHKYMLEHTHAHLHKLTFHISLPHCLASRMRWEWLFFHFEFLWSCSTQLLNNLPFEKETKKKKKRKEKRRITAWLTDTKTQTHNRENKTRLPPAAVRDASWHAPQWER